MDDDEIRRRINNAIAGIGDGDDKISSGDGDNADVPVKQERDSIGELSDLLAQLPKGTRCDTVVNSYYRLRVGDGSLLVVKNSMYVDQEKYMVHKIRIGVDGVVSEDVVECVDDLESLRESVLFLNGYAKKRSD